MTHSKLQKLLKILPVILISILITTSALIAATNEKNPPPATLQADDSTVVVEMTNTMNFIPDTVRIKKGETIKWENTSLLAHTVTADTSVASRDISVQLPKGAESFDSGMLDPDQTFTHTFNTPGTYQYFCIPHEGTKMFGWIIVTEQ